MIQEFNLPINGEKNELEFGIQDFPIIEYGLNRNNQNYWIFNKEAESHANAFMKFVEITQAGCDSLIAGKLPELMLNMLGKTILLDESNLSGSKRLYFDAVHSPQGYLEHKSYLPLVFGLLMHAVLQFFPVGLSYHQRIVSMGSGVGMYEMYLALLLHSLNRVFHIDCIEKSEAACWLSRNFREHLFQNDSQYLYLHNKITMHNTDMVDSGLPHNSADVIIAIQSLMLCEQWEHALQEFKRILDPYGSRQLLLIVPLASGLTVQMGSGIKNISNFNIFSLLDQLELLGFQLEHIRTIYAGDGAGHYGQGDLLRFFISANLAKDPIIPWRSKLSLQNFLATFPFKYGIRALEILTQERI